MVHLATPATLPGESGLPTRACALPTKEANGTATSTRPANIKSKLEAAGITVLDLTDVKTDDRLNHSKFAESPEIVQLLGAQLASGQSLTDSEVGLGDELGLMIAGTVDTVGNVAATTVRAPIAIVEGKTNQPAPDELETILKGDATTE